MPNKCAVAGCKTGYLTASTKPMFKFPSDSSLREKWIQFLQRQDYSPSSNSSICIDHFEEKYLIRHPNRVRLNTSLYPIPTIHPSSTPQSQAVIPKPCRKPPTERIFQPDELPLFSDMFSVGSLNDVVTYLHTAEEYKGFTFVVTEVSITAYLLYINSGIATIKECIHIDSDLHVQLSYEGVPLPLPAYICKQSGKLHSLDLLTNLPSYCRNATCSYDVGVIKKLVNVSYYSPKGRPKYSSDVLKFALMLRYISHSAYQFLSNFLPLPSEPLLRKLKSRSVITSDALCLLRDNGLIGNDIVLLLDEMYLQPQVQFTGTTLIGCDDNLKVYKSILTFMVVSLKRCVPFVLKAIPLVKLSHILVRDMIISCIISLTESNFQLRAVISDNHSTNVGAYKDLLKMYPIQGKNYSIFNPKCHLSEIYLMYDTVHLVKNIRNNLLASRFFQIPEFSCITNGISIHVTAGNVRWSHLHQVHAKDLELNAHLRKAPKVGYKVLHPGNNKQSVPLALAIFEETTFTAIRSYLPEEHTTADFLQLIHFWWLIVNSKERFHPNPIGNALKMNDSRCDLLSRISLWLENWRDDKTLGLSRQTFDALIKTNRAIADLSNALLSEGYE